MSYIPKTVMVLQESETILHVFITDALGEICEFSIEKGWPRVTLTGVCADVFLKHVPSGETVFKYPINPEFPEELKHELEQLFWNPNFKPPKKKQREFL